MGAIKNTSTYNVLENKKRLFTFLAQSAGAVEYIDCTSAEG